jgi:membrane-associated phospholipid phosphatase
MTAPGRDGDGDEALPPGLTDRGRRAVTAAALGVGALAALLSVTVARHDPWAWETGVVRDATDVWDVFGFPARAVMQLGTFGGVVSLAVVTAWLCARRERELPARDPSPGWRARLGYRIAPLAVLAGGVLALTVSNRTKALVERGRPVGVRLREAQEGFGYPSTHSATAFGVALVLTFLVPRRWRWVPIALATVVGVTRMHVGVHYPLDVLGGALVGIAAGLLVVAVLDPARRS